MANRRTFRQKWLSYKKRPGSLILFILVSLSALVTAALVVSLVVYILVKGIPHLKPDLFAWKYTTENSSMMPAIINTVIMTLLSLLIAGPLGIFSAIYMTEYARKGNKLVGLVRTTTETLAGIPSIVYGLFGQLLFVLACGFDYSMLAGALTMSIMILPTIMRTTEEALLSVPDAYREGSFGLGAGRLRTVFRIVLPSAIPGILTGVILAIGRVAGETAALIYTAGTVAGIPDSLMRSGRTLSVHMYALLNEGLYMEQAYATAVVLLAMVVLINALSAFLSRKITAKGG
ncbi:MAG: phosphate ABC transporter permease PstA [Clostridia bacterium]